MQIDQNIIDKIRKSIPAMIAEELCSVQPIDVDMVAILKDPLINQMLTNFVNRQMEK